MKLNILVVVPINIEQAELFRNAAPDCEFCFRRYSGERKTGNADLGTLVDYLPLTQEDVDKAEIILGNVPESMLHSNKGLKWYQTNSAGVEPFIKPGVLHPDTILTNATGGYGLAISEHMLGMLLMVMKKLELYRDAQKTASWKSLGDVRSIYGSTVLVLGMGDIGGEFGKRCKALGARVIGVRRVNAEKPDYADELHLLDDLDSLLPQADVVAITLPGTEKTRNLMDRSRIEKMKSGGIIINVGRGYILDTDAVTDGLISGKLGGACLDVTEPEPLPSDHPLWNIPNAIITPHISGYFHLKATHERIIALMLKNLNHFMKNEPMENVIDFETGYRRS